MPRTDRTEIDLPTCARHHVCPDGLDSIEGSTAASLVMASADSIEPRCSQPAPSCRPPHLRKKCRVQKPGRDGSHRAATQPPRGTHGNLPRLVWKKAALASGVRRSRLASALSQRSLSQRPRPPARGASPLMWPDPPSTTAVLLSVLLGRHRATGADPATASRQTDPTWQPPQATTIQPPRHLREELGPQLCSRHCAVSSWLQTLIRYSCLNLNACEDAICRADKPKMPLLAQFPTLFSLDCIYLPPPTSSIRRNKLRGRPMPRAGDRKKPEAPFSWPRARLRGKDFAVAWAPIVCEPPFPFDF